jgi:hypothetical protein
VTGATEGFSPAVAPRSAACRWPRALDTASPVGRMTLYVFGRCGRRQSPRRPAGSALFPERVA